MTYRGFIVIGPEDSGNRMMQNILVQAGCYGQDRYEIPFNQALDHVIPRPERDIAWLRSVPHNGSYPDLSRMIIKLFKAGYDPVVLVMTRAWWVTRKAATVSHTRDQFVSDNQLRDAYLHIFSNILKAERRIGHLLEYYLVSYDELVHDKNALPELLKLLSLPEIDFEFINANRKWYRKWFNDNLCDDPGRQET